MKIRCALLALLLLAGCYKKAPPPVTLTFPVRVLEAGTKEVELFIEALGHVESVTSIDIRSRIQGELTGVYFEQGQEVKKGDLLFTIDPRPYEAAKKQAQGTLSSTLANLSLAEEKVKRYRTLAREEYYSQLDYETLQSNYAALLAQKEQNEGALEKALVDLNYCWIYAPIDGKTGILQIDYGNLISADGKEPLLTLNQMDPIYVTFSIPEFQLSKILECQTEKPLTVRAAFEDFSGAYFSGDLTLIDNAVDASTGMIKCRATFSNEARRLWPGQFVRTRTILKTLPHAVSIPYSCVQITSHGPVLFILKEETMTVEERAVTLGQRDGEDILVLTGLKPGEKVVSEGQLNLSQGTKVFLTDGGAS